MGTPGASKAGEGLGPGPREDGRAGGCCHP